MRIAVSGLLAALAAAAPAQTTRLVGPAGLAQIRDALAISSPGDVIQVQPGTYAQFTAVHLQGCTLAAIGSNLKGHAMTATNAKVTATGCSFTGNSTTGVYDQPGNGIRLSNTTLQGSSLTVQGGSLLAGSTGAAALSADGSCRVWISDSTLTGGGSTCPVSSGGAAGRIDRSTLSPAGPTCSSLPPGLVLGIERLQPLQNGAVFTLNHRTDPNAWVAVFVSPSPGDASAPGLLEQPVSLSPASFWNAGLFVADPTGFVAAAWNIPAGPAFVDLQLWFQGVSGQSLPLQTSPVAGGTVR